MANRKTTTKYKENTHTNAATIHTERERVRESGKTRGRESYV